MERKSLLVVIFNCISVGWKCYLTCEVMVFIKKIKKNIYSFHLPALACHLKKIINYSRFLDFWFNFYLTFSNMDFRYSFGFWIYLLHLRLRTMLIYHRNCDKIVNHKCCKRKFDFSSVLLFWQAHFVRNVHILGTLRRCICRVSSVETFYLIDALADSYKFKRI